MRPMNPASTTTERSTWARDAPMARSRASSRTRWPMTMAKVL